MLEGFVADFQITSDQFVDACARGLASDDIDEVRPAGKCSFAEQINMLQARAIPLLLHPLYRNSWNVCLQLTISSCSNQSW